MLGATFGCGGTQEPSKGSAAVEVSFQALTGDDVASLKVSVSGDGIDQIIVSNLTKTDGKWTGVIGDIPVGANRTFLAQAYDSGSSLVFQGSATGVTISKDDVAVVLILLQQTVAPPPYENGSPYITSATASTGQTTPGGVVTLSIAAADPDGDALTYSWTATAGSLSPTDQASTTWTAPSTDGSQTIKVSVTDGKGSTAGISFTINVQTVIVKGSADVRATMNTWPLITSTTVSAGQIGPGESTDLSVDASDSDLDPLSLNWSDGCGGIFDSINSPSSKWTAPTSAPLSGFCTLTVAVADGRGGSNTGSITVKIGTPTIILADVVASVTLDRTTLNLEIGGATATLTATVMPSGASNKSVSWASGNPSVATVSDTGVVSPVGSGTAIITVTTLDGSKTATCDVTVTNADTTAPADVTGIVATTPLSGQVALAWTDPSDADLDHIEITYPALATPISVAKGVQTAIISGLTIDTAVTFTLKAVDSSGNSSVGVNHDGTPKIVTYRLKTSYSEGGNPLYIATTHSSTYPTAHDGIMILLNAGCVAGPTSFIWNAWPGLANPADPTLISLESAETPGTFLRIDSANLTRWPANINQCYGWSLGGVAAPKDHITFIEPDDLTAPFKSDATFKIVPALNGNAAMRSLQWHGGSSYYLQHAYYHILGRTGSALNNTDASLTLEVQ